VTRLGSSIRSGCAKDDRVRALDQLCLAGRVAGGSYARGTKSGCSEGSVPGGHYSKSQAVPTSTMLRTGLERSAAITS
jgi:hypothetical protein